MNILKKIEKWLLKDYPNYKFHKKLGGIRPLPKMNKPKVNPKGQGVKV